VALKVTPTPWQIFKPTFDATVTVAGPPATTLKVSGIETTVDCVTQLELETICTLYT
jgi:hypothetical protein